MESFEEFKKRVRQENPDLKDASEDFLRKKYKEMYGVEPGDVPSLARNDHSDPEVENSYSTLRTLAKIVSGIGWLWVGIVGLAFLITLFQDSSNGYMLLGAILISTFGFFIVAQGQLISCIVDIQRNTERIVSLMQEET